MVKRNKTAITFIGIDLAWSRRNSSGGAVIRRNRLLTHTDSLGDDEAILRFVGDHLSFNGPAIVAVDAPLRVPNQHGSRRCDRELSADWHRFQAGAYPANRHLLARDGVVRGEAIVQALMQRYCFTEAAPIPRHTQSRLICEVYPHPAMVSLFGLERTLKYKARNRRDYETRWSEMSRYQKLLRGLRQATPALEGTEELLTGTNVRTLRGSALKAYEDRLDAVVCAYIASYLWYHGPGVARVYGTMAEGHILVPVTPEMAQRLPEDQVQGPR